MKILKFPCNFLSVLFLANILAFMTFPPMIAAVHGMLPSSELIYPGVGIDTVKIGEPRPAKLPQHLEKNVREHKIVIEVQGNQKTVTRITISSPDFILARSQLRVKSSSRDEVQRFYGKGRTEEMNTKQTVQFPSEGLEFVINKRSGKVESISVFPPVRPKIQIKQYQMYKNQFKQLR